MQNEIQQKYREILELQASAEHCLEMYEKQLRADHQAKISELEEQQKTSTEQATATAQQQVADVMSRLKYTAAPWDIEAWLGYPEDTPDDAITESIRAGYVSSTLSSVNIQQIPLLIPFIDEGHILLISTGPAKNTALEIHRNLVFRSMLQVANDNTEYIMIDPIGMGTNFPFQELPTSLRGEMVYVEEDEIESQLRRLTDQIRSGDKQKRYILCVADFPRRFSEDALQRLLTISQHGVNANIYMIIHVDSDIPLPDGFGPSTLSAVSSAIYVTPDGTTAKVDDEEFSFVPDGLPDSTLFNALIKKVAGK